MPTTLSTTLSKIEYLPNAINATLVAEFHQYMVSNGASERHQNNSLKMVIAFAIYLGPTITFYDLERPEQIIPFLDTKIKSADVDPDKKWITTWNYYLVHIKLFLRWLYNSGRKDHAKSSQILPESNWETPPAARIKKKRTKRLSPYSETEIWDREELFTILKYEPEIRNKAVLTLFWDLDARNHEITSLKIGNIRLRERYAEGEIPHNTKTGGGPILLTCSFPYVRDWLNKHPHACKGEYMFTMIGAAVDIPHKVYKHLSTLGPKLYFLRLPRVEHSEDYYLENMKVNFQGKIEEIRAALYEYLAVFEVNPDIVSSEEGPPKIPMNYGMNEELTCKHIVKLAQLLGPLRAAVPTWRTEDTQGSSYAYSIPNIEEPSRAITILQNLAAGHALSQGRDHITIEDIPIIIQIVLSTASLERSKIFDLLISNDGYLKTRDVVRLLNTTPPTARRAMTELKAVGLVNLDEDVVPEDEAEENRHGRPGLQMTLKEEYKWFLIEDFLRLRKGDTSRVYEEEDKEEKSPGRNEVGEDKKEILPPHSAINNVLYDCIIHKTISQGGILSC